MDSMEDTKVYVKSVRYFETRRGLGYQCKTNLGFEIWNDGSRGGTYIDGAGVMPNRVVYEVLRKQFPDADLHSYDIEEALEGLINEYESVK